MFLAAALIAGLGLGTRVGWTPAAIVGVVVGVGAGIGALIGLLEVGSPRPSSGTPCRFARRSPRPKQLVEQNKDWVKNEFDSKLRELEKKPGKEGADAEEDDGSPRRRVPGAPAKADRRGRQEISRPSSRQIQRRHDDGIKKVEDHYPPRIAALKEKYENDRRELDESYARPRQTTQEQYNRPGTS